MRHNPGHGIMTELMENCPKPIDRLEICVDRGNLHIVETGMIERLAAADSNDGAGRRDDGVRRGNDRLGWRQSRCGVSGQTFALVGVEQREAFEERDARGDVSGLAGPLALCIRGEAIGIDDGDAVLAFSHAAAGSQSLTKSEPAMPGEFAFRDRGPKREDVDPRILSPGRCVAWNRERRRRGLRIPRLRPRHAAAFEIGDDAVSDVLIDVGAVVHSHGGGLLDGGRETLSPLHSVADPLPRSHSRRVAGQTARFPGLGGHRSRAGSSPQAETASPAWRAAFGRD